MARLLDEATQRSLRVRAPRVQEQPVAVAERIRIDALPDRAGGVAAAHRERLDEQMRQRVEEDIRAAREVALRRPPLEPMGMTAGQALEPGEDVIPLEPVLDSFRSQQEKDALAPILDGREPLRVL